MTNRVAQRGISAHGNRFVGILEIIFTAFFLIFIFVDDVLI